MGSGMKSNIRKAAPSAVSAASMLLGLASMVMAASGRFELAAWFIIYCTFLDKADGSLARALNASSRFGVEMDSYSDFTAFGLAPAALTWFSLGGDPPATTLWVAFGSLTWVLMTAIRLARFNLESGGESEDFEGVPTTLAAGVFASLFLTLDHQGLLDQWGPALVPVVLGLAVMMVGRLRIPKIRARRSKAFNVFQASLILLALVVAVLQAVPEVLLVLSAGYLVIGAIAARRKPTTATGDPG